MRMTVYQVQVERGPIQHECIERKIEATSLMLLLLDCMLCKDKLLNALLRLGRITEIDAMNICERTSSFYKQNACAFLTLKSP